MFEKLEPQQVEMLQHYLKQAGKDLSEARRKAIEILKTSQPAWIRSAQRAIISRSLNTILEMREIYQQLREETDVPGTEGEDDYRRMARHSADYGRDPQ